jgi:excisionase family DNA binding protein
MAAETEATMLPAAITERRPIGMRAGQAARFLGLSRTTFYSLVADGRAPKPRVSFGRKIKLWSVEDLERWLASGGASDAAAKKARRS